MPIRILVINLDSFLIRQGPKYQRRLSGNKPSHSHFPILKKSYDATWKYEIKRDMREYGLRRMLIFESNFLDDRFILKYE